MTRSFPPRAYPTQGPGSLTCTGRRSVTAWPEPPDSPARRPDLFRMRRGSGFARSAVLRCCYGYVRQGLLGEYLQNFLVAQTV